MPQPRPLRLLREPCGSHPTATPPAATLAATVSRDRAAEARAFDLGGRICRRAREIGAERSIPASSTKWAMLMDNWFLYPAGAVRGSIVLGYVQSFSNGSVYRREAMIRVPGTAELHGSYDVKLGDFDELADAKAAVAAFLAAHGRVDPLIAGLSAAVDRAEAVR